MSNASPLHPWRRSYKEVTVQKEKLKQARTQCWRRKSSEQRKEDMNDPVYREAYNEAQRIRRAMKKEAA